MGYELLYGPVVIESSMLQTKGDAMPKCSALNDQNACDGSKDNPTGCLWNTQHKVCEDNLYVCDGNLKNCPRPGWITKWEEQYMSENREDRLTFTIFPDGLQRDNLSGELCATLLKDGTAVASYRFTASEWKQKFSFCFRSANELLVFLKNMHENMKSNIPDRAGPAATLLADYEQRLP